MQEIHWTVREDVLAWWGFGVGMARTRTHAKVGQDGEHARGVRKNEMATQDGEQARNVSKNVMANRG